jgi:class 3 adenylate cyclase
MFAVLSRGEQSAAAFDQKLRNKMLLRVLVTAGVILLTLAAATFLVTRSLMARELEEKARSKVEHAALVVNAWLQEKGTMLAVLADRESREPTSDEFKKAYFREMAATYGGFESVYMGWEDGAFLTGADFVPPEGYDPRARPWYQAAMAADGVGYSPAYRDLHTGKLVVSVAAPVRAEGRPEAVISMDIFVDEILAVVEALRIDQAGYAYVVDEAGTFIAHPDPDKVLQGNVADGDQAAIFSAFREQGAVGTAIYEANDYVTVSRIAQSDWYVFFHLPRSVINRPLRSLALIFLAGILAALLLLAFTISYISHNIAQPILELVDGAQKISRGEYERKLPVQSRDEIGYLTQSFNEMADGLKDREFIKSTFGRYVSPEVMREILDGNIALGGEAKEISVMFSDIRGFTSFSEDMDPHQLVTMLNDYFTRMDQAISAEGGSINKYMGDGILAIFGAPVALDSSPLAAVRAARAMLVQLAEFNQRFDRTLTIGIGIHTGEAVVGNIGSEQRTEYTAIGDSVNLASRIEGLTKPYGVPILVSEDTALRLPDDYLLRVIDRVRVKGKHNAVNIFHPMWKRDLSETETERIARANLAMERYLRGEFTRALEVIEQLTGGLDDHLRLIQQRCREYVAAPPERWEGVVTFETK